MPKTIATFVLLLGLPSIAAAQTVTKPDEIASKLRFWSQDASDPVYYGEVRSVDARTKRIAGHYQCLALAFIDYKDGVFQYAHKMWAKSRDGSCHYEDVTSRKVGNHGACVKDSEAGFGAAVGTARMSKANIDFGHSIFRTVDTNTRRVGETKACVPPKGLGAGLFSVSITNGRFQVITTRPLAYLVNIKAQDPAHPPTDPVF